MKLVRNNKLKDIKKDKDIREKLISMGFDVDSTSPKVVTSPIESSKHKLSPVPKSMYNMNLNSDHWNVLTIGEAVTIANNNKKLSWKKIASIQIGYDLLKFFFDDKFSGCKPNLTYCHQQYIKDFKEIRDNYEIGFCSPTNSYSVFITQELRELFAHIESKIISFYKEYKDRIYVCNDSAFLSCYYGEGYTNLFKSDSNLSVLIHKAYKSYNRECVSRFTSGNLVNLWPFLNLIKYCGLQEEVFSVIDFDVHNWESFYMSAPTVHVDTVSLKMEDGTYKNRINESLKELLEEPQQKEEQKVLTEDEPTWNKERRQYVFDNVKYKEDAERVAEELNNMYKGLNINKNNVLGLFNQRYDISIYYKDSKHGTRITEEIAKGIKEYALNNANEVFKVRTTQDTKYLCVGTLGTKCIDEINKYCNTNLYEHIVRSCLQRMICSEEITLEMVNFKNTSEQTHTPVEDKETQQETNEYNEELLEIDTTIRTLLPQVGSLQNLLDVVKSNNGISKAKIMKKLSIYNGEFVIISRILDKLKDTGELEYTYEKKKNAGCWYIKGARKPEVQENKDKSLFRKLINKIGEALVKV